MNYQISDTDIFYMETALALAEKGRGFVSPNPLVGAVVVKDGKIAGRGWHEKAGEAHAEVNAINDAGELSEGADIYVTLEPCNHTGKTPPCTEKILASGIRRVFSAMDDHNPGVKGGGNDYLRSKGIEVFTGICEKAAKKQNEIFIKYITSRKPFVIAKCASTLDGRIATRTGDSKWITCEESRLFVHELRHCCDAILVGIGTVRADNPMLTARLDGRVSIDPVRIILDSRLEISPDARVLKADSDSGAVVVCSGHVSEKLEERIASEKVKVLRVPEKSGILDMKAVMEQLGAMQITSVLVEGGSRVLASAFASGIVDRVNFFYAPVILGGDDGFPICRGAGPEFMRDATRLENVSVRRFGDDVMIEGYL